MLACIKRLYPNPFSGNSFWTHTPEEASEVPSVRSFKSLKQSLIIIPWESSISTNYHQLTLTYLLRSHFCHKIFSFHMPSNPIPTQPTSPLNKDPPLDKGNLICLIECLPQLKAILYFMVVMHFMVFNSMFHPLPFHTTNMGHTKPRGPRYKLDTTECTKARAHFQPNQP